MEVATKMAQMVKVCTCDNCGNEAEMTITCKEIDIEQQSGVKGRMQQETRVCQVCGNETTLADFGPNIIE